MASIQPLSPVRRSCRPIEGDTYESIATRELRAADIPEGVASLRGWNPHLGNRRSLDILVSDVVFLEAPPKVMNQGGWA